MILYACAKLSRRYSPVARACIILSDPGGGQGLVRAPLSLIRVCGGRHCRPGIIHALHHPYTSRINTCPHHPYTSRINTSPHHPDTSRVNTSPIILIHLVLIQAPIILIHLVLIHQPRIIPAHHVEIHGPIIPAHHVVIHGPIIPAHHVLIHGPHYHYTSRIYNAKQIMRTQSK